MDALSIVRSFFGEGVAIACGLFGMISAWEDGLMLYVAVSFALVGVSFALAGVRYKHVIAEPTAG